MNHSIIQDPELFASNSIGDSERSRTVRTLSSTPRSLRLEESLSKGRMENTRFLQLLDALIENIFRRLENNSLQPKIRDALKAIQLRQNVAKSSETEKLFWELIESIGIDELKRFYPQTFNLESQILNTIIGLKQQVKNGILPVKTITDLKTQNSGTFNQGRSKESKLTYHRIGRLLSKMGFRKAKTRTGTYAILWDDNLLPKQESSNDEKNEKQSAASPACPASPIGSSRAEGS